MNYRIDKLIYVAGPFRGPSAYSIHQNVNHAEMWAYALWDAGFAVICPHLNTAHFDKSLPDETFLRGDLTILRRCDAVFLVPGWEKSQGAKSEAAEARKAGIPVYTSVFELLDAYPVESD